MPDYKTNTRIVLTDPDLPEPGEVREHHIGPYTILIDHPGSGAGRLVVPSQLPVMPPDPQLLAAFDEAAKGAEKPAEDKPEASPERFVVALMDLKKTIYTHAVEVRRHGRRARVADFALCNGRNNGRPVRGRDTTRTLADVDCPRCLRRIEQATTEETT